MSAQGRTSSPAPRSLAELNNKSVQELEKLAVKLGATDEEIKKVRKSFNEKGTAITLVSDLQKKPKSQSFFQKHIAPNIFNFYPAASVCGLLYFGFQNKWSFYATLANGGDWIVFLLCVKVFMIHNGLAHLFNYKIIHKSQGLVITPGSQMFENELGALCLCLGIWTIVSSSVSSVAVVAKTNGCFCLYAGVRHIYHGQPAGTSIPGMLTGALLLIAGLHAEPVSMKSLMNISL